MSSNSDTKETRHKKGRFAVFLFLIIFFLFIIAYSIIQYEVGRNDATQDSEITEQLDFDLPQIKIEKTDDQEKQEFHGHLNVLLIGVDTNEGEKARTDTIMIAQYNPEEQKMKLASIMRDCYVTIPGFQDNKINTSFFLGGPDLLRETIQENFELDIPYFAMVNFDGFQHLVDVIAPSGLNVTVQKRMYYNSGSMLIDFQPGRHTLNGAQTLNYVRFRSDHENDFGRVRRQQEILSLLKDELLTIGGLTRIPRVIGSLEPHIKTNVSTSKIIGLGKDFLLHPVKEIETLTVPVSDGYTDKRYAHAGAVLELDLEKNKKALQEFLQTSNTSIFAKKKES